VLRAVNKNEAGEGELSDKGRREEGKSKARDWFSEEEICQN
jgi:hypothetical protein